MRTGSTDEGRLALATFVLDSDEPTLLLGQNQGANAVELVLAALASCMTGTIVYFGAAMGIQLEPFEQGSETFLRDVGRNALESREVDEAALERQVLIEPALFRHVADVVQLQVRLLQAGLEGMLARPLGVRPGHAGGGARYATFGQDHRLGGGGAHVDPCGDDH